MKNTKTLAWETYQAQTQTLADYGGDVDRYTGDLVEFAQEQRWSHDGTSDELRAAIRDIVVQDAE